MADAGTGAWAVTPNPPNHVPLTADEAGGRGGAFRSGQGFLHLAAGTFSAPARTPPVPGLLGSIEDARVFIGNDSGPGHLAALCGEPTFTLFGPHLPENWAPLHPAAEWLLGRPCPYKPCEDYCRFGVHHCLVDVNAEEAWINIEPFLKRHCGRAAQ